MFALHYHQQAGGVQQLDLGLERLLPGAAVRVRRPQGGAGRRRLQGRLRHGRAGEDPQAQLLRGALVLEDRPPQDGESES